MVKRLTGLMLALAMTLVGCSKDAGRDTPVDPDKPAITETNGRTTALTIEADVESALRSASVYLKQGDRMLPIIDLDRLQVDMKHPKTGASVKGVMVHVIIKSDDASQPTTIRTVPFVRDGKKLCCAGQDIALAPGTAFDNQGGRKWFVMAILGGNIKTEAGGCVGTNGADTDLGWTTGTGGPADYAGGRLEVPMAVLPWREIAIASSGSSASAGSDNRFKMMGSLLRVVIKNNLALAKGNLHDFQGMEMYSNAFSTNGYFKFDTPREGGLPTWNPRSGQPGTLAVSMKNPRTGASEQFAKIDIFGAMASKSVAKGDSIENVLWVMPNASVTDANRATIVRLGTMRMGEHPHKYFTTREDEITPTNPGGYEVRKGQLVQGRVHPLTLSIVRPVLPLEFVAEHNVGTTAKRFAPDHVIDNQGFYRGEPSSSSTYGYGAAGAEQAVPEGYHLPTLEELSGIFSTLQVYGDVRCPKFDSYILFNHKYSRPWQVRSDGLIAMCKAPISPARPVAVAGATYELPADYYNAYALRYMSAGKPDDVLLKSAWSYRFLRWCDIGGRTYVDVLEVRTRWVGDPSLAGSQYSVLDIANEDFFNPSMETQKPKSFGPVVTRYFVATGKKIETCPHGKDKGGKGGTKGLYTSKAPSCKEKGCKPRLEWVDHKYVKLNGKPYTPGKQELFYSLYGGRTKYAPHVIFDCISGGTLHCGDSFDHLPVRPFIDPKTLGY